jgi:hypothetical protein
MQSAYLSINSTLPHHPQTHDSAHPNSDFFAPALSVVIAAIIINGILFSHLAVTPLRTYHQLRCYYYFYCMPCRARLTTRRLVLATGGSQSARCATVLVRRPDVMEDAARRLFLVVALPCSSSVYPVGGQKKNRSRILPQVFSTIHSVSRFPPHLVSFLTHIQ